MATLGIFQVGRVLYLCEAKHNMTLKQVNKLRERIQKFKEFHVHTQPESSNVIFVILCATLFPKDIRVTALQQGFICVYPSGNRYDVPNPKDDFIIER
jgi:hypothetical protein